MTPPDRQPFLLQLALRLISTAPEPSTAKPERFYLHLCFLRELQQFEEGMKLLDSDIGRMYCETNLNLEELRHQICMGAGKKVEEWELAKNRLVLKRSVLRSVLVE